MAEVALSTMASCGVSIGVAHEEIPVAARRSLERLIVMCVAGVASVTEEGVSRGVMAASGVAVMASESGNGVTQIKPAYRMAVMTLSQWHGGSMAAAIMTGVISAMWHIG